MLSHLILASKSSTRQRLLANAGIDFEVCAAQIDEDAIRSRCRKENKIVETTALKIARTKGSVVSAKFPESFVISADQVLEQDKKWYEKPSNRAAARAQLKALSGGRHRLITACCVYFGNNEKWHDISIAQMSVRNLSNTFIEQYLDSIGNDAFISVGAYQLEGRGVNLFDAIDGDFFSILGLPLLPLLARLRQLSAKDTI